MTDLPPSAAAPTAPADSTAAAPPAPDHHDDVADGRRHRLDPRFVVTERVPGLVLWTSVALILLAAVALGIRALDAAPPTRYRWVPYAAWGLFIVLRLGWTWVRPAIVLRHASYRFDAYGLEIRSGAYWRTIVSIPRSRVQHTDVTQDPIERRYGLGTLVVHTAGVTGAAIALPGIPHERALRIRDALLPHAPDVV